MRLFILFIIVLTAFVSCGEDKCNTNETDKCKDVICDEWQQCNPSNGQCETKENRCSNNGECSGVKICDTNHNCVNTIDPCEGQSCSNFGECAVINNIAKCFCNAGYKSEGLNCVEVIINLCENVTCDEWEQCNSSNGNCETKENRCSNNGECSGVQICDINHNCVNPIDPCEGQSCSNFGECAIINNTAKCFCNAGYTAEGLTCVDINECEENTDNCPNGYTCENTAGGFICNDVNECDLNNGDCSHYCINAVGYYTCSCNERYYLDTDGLSCKPKPFITTWKTDNSGSSASNQVTIPITGTGYNYHIDCNNDGIYEAENITDNYTCIYQSAGIYQVAITGDFPRIFFNGSGDRYKILSINQWGAIQWQSMEKAFSGCSNLTEQAVDTPDLSNVSNMSYMFSEATFFNGDINNWDVSTISNMSYMFYNASSFNSDLNNWDVSNVSDMAAMFLGASSFNQDLSLWDVSNVITMAAMFSGASSFNQDLSLWDVSSVTSMINMFFGATSFNQDLNLWDVSNVADMSGMFYNVTSFNSNLSNWDVSNVRNMNHMFLGATSFNSDISNWDVSNVTLMSYMFNNATSFNSNLSNWDVSNVTTMNGMFKNATSFNSNISSWNVSKVTYMPWMFQNATSFNQNLSSWDVDQVTLCGSVYSNTPAWLLPKPNFTSCNP